MNKVVCIGLARPPYTKRGYRVYCNIKFEDGHLSFSGVEGPLPNGNARGSCGQIIMSEWDIAKYAKGWSAELEAKFRAVWERWHLNDMRAGTPAQEAWLRENPINAVYPENHYEKACEALAAVGLNPDNRYKYGSKWLFEEVSQDVLDFLQALPDSEITPAWI